MNALHCTDVCITYRQLKQMLSKPGQHHDLNAYLYDLISKYKQGESSVQLQLIQSSLHCCGVQSWHDCVGILPLPSSCCSASFMQAHSTCIRKHAFSVGCVAAMKKTQAAISVNFVSVIIFLATNVLLCLATILKLYKLSKKFEFV